MNFENLVLPFHVLTIQTFPVQSIWILTNGCLQTILAQHLFACLKTCMIRVVSDLNQFPEWSVF